LGAIVKEGSESKNRQKSEVLRSMHKRSFAKVPSAGDVASLAAGDTAVGFTPISGEK
jgi:hypothetical protein